MTDLTRAVVAVDVGTSAVRAALVDLDRGVDRAVRVARADAAGGVVFDAEQLVDDVAAALRGLELDGGPAALSISAHIGAVAVDERLQPVTLAAGWADTRGVDALGALDAGMLHAAGRPVVTGGALALGAALAGSPRAGEVHAILSPKDFLVARLTGVLRTDVVDAAYSLAFDVRAKRWRDDSLQAVGVPRSWMPKAVEATAVVGAVHSAATSFTGLPAGVPVVAGGPDGSVGLGLLLGQRTDVLGDVAGTTDVLGRLVDADSAPPGAVVNPALVSDRWVAGGATGMTGGAVARWRSLVGAVDDDALAAVPPGCDGLRIVPTLSGSRFPRWDSSTRGAVLGQTPEHGPAHLLRAAQEGSAFVVREGLDLLDPDRVLPVVIAGGAMRSPHVAQLRADLLGRTMLVASDPDVTLLGAAALAGIGVGLVPGLDEARERLGVRFAAVEPDAGRGAVLDGVHGEWRLMSQSMRGTP